MPTPAPSPSPTITPLPTAYVPDYCSFGQVGSFCTGVNDNIGSYGSVEACWEACYEQYDEGLVAINWDSGLGGCYCQDACNSCSATNSSSSLAVLRGFGSLPASCGSGSLTCKEREPFGYQAPLTPCSRSRILNNPLTSPVSPSRAQIPNPTNPRPRLAPTMEVTIRGSDDDFSPMFIIGSTDLSTSWNITNSLWDSVQIYVCAGNASETNDDTPKNSTACAKSPSCSIYNTTGPGDVGTYVFGALSTLDNFTTGAMNSICIAGSGHPNRFAYSPPFYIIKPAMEVALDDDSKTAFSMGDQVHATLSVSNMPNLHWKYLCEVPSMATINSTCSAFPGCKCLESSENLAISEDVWWGGNPTTVVGAKYIGGHFQVHVSSPPTVSPPTTSASLPPHVRRWSLRLAFTPRPRPTRPHTRVWCQIVWSGLPPLFRQLLRP